MKQITIQRFGLNHVEYVHQDVGHTILIRAITLINLDIVTAIKVFTVEIIEIQVKFIIHLIESSSNMIVCFPTTEQSVASGSGYGDSKDSIHSHSDHRENELGKFLLHKVD